MKFPPVNLYVVMSAGAFMQLQGCASVEELRYAYESQAAIVAAQTQAHQEPLFSLKCGSEKDACKGLAFEYNPAKPPVTVPKVTNTNDTILGVADPIVTGVGYIVGGVTAIRLADKIMDNVGNGNVHTTSVTSVVGDNNGTSSNPTVSKQSHDGITDSHDVSNTDNSTSDSHDATSTPTVVTQPTPVIVKPEIVKPEVVLP